MKIQTDRKIGYWLGYILGHITVIFVVSVVVFAAAKFVLWLF